MRSDPNSHNVLPADSAFARSKVRTLDAKPSSDLVQDRFAIGRDAIPCAAPFNVTNQTSPMYANTRSRLNAETNTGYAAGCGGKHHARCGTGDTPDHGGGDFSYMLNQRHRCLYYGWAMATGHRPPPYGIHFNE